MAAQIVEDDYVARFERRCEEALDVDAENDAVHGTVDHEGGCDAVVTQCRNESGGFPVPMRPPGDQAYAARASAVIARHVGFGPGFVDKNQMPGIKGRLIVPPFSASCRHVGPVLFACEQGFF